MTRSGYFTRLAISVLIDAADLVFGWMPGVGTAEDGVGAVAVFALWGKPGLAYVFEFVDVFDFTDAVLPTATLIGLYVGWREGFLFPRKKLA
ncbi:MAG TPA: hypothetical protein VG841_14825 [Caulobacterales bacterium]|nr:hypothetical protein [Caulobacterales bacterium]